MIYVIITIITMNYSVSNWDSFISAPSTALAFVIPASQTDRQFSQTLFLTYTIPLNPCTLNQMLRPKVRTQVQNLPAAQRDEQPGGAETEPFNAGVCALVGVAQAMLARAEIVKLVDDFADSLLDTTQVRLDRFELLGRLDGGPVFGVGANVNV